MSIRISCPYKNESKEKRIADLFQSISEWIYSSDLLSLINLYDGNIPAGLSLKEYIGWLNNFTEIWDYRKKQADGGERWNIKESSFVDAKQNEIMRFIENLGLTNITEPEFTPNYILPLGGARLTNLHRPMMARYVIDQYSLNNISVVALAGSRPIHEIEKPYVSQYAPNADTEYDAICKGMETAFGLSENYEEDYIENNNVNLQSSMRKYKDRYKESCFYVSAAPSSDPARRANSLDTFKYFLKRFSINSDDTILLTTSCIYVPFQLLKFMELAIETGAIVDCIGVNTSISQSSLVKPIHYLQEIKSTINAIYTLSNIYLN